MLTTGTVSLSLAEVDKLRDTIKEKEALVKEKDAEIEKLKADSKQVLVTEQELCYGFNEWEVSQVLRKYAQYACGNYDRYGRSHSIYTSVDLHEDLIRAMIPGQYKNKKVYYKNLDDVKKDIRDELELEYQEEIRSSKAEARRVTDRVKEVQEEEQKKSTEIQKELQNQLSDKDEVIEAYDKKCRELESGKKELSMIEELTKQLSKLEDQLIKEQRKKWYHKLFS